MRPTIALLMTIVLSCLLVPAASAQPTLRLDAPTIVATGLTPNGSAVLVGVVRDRSGHQTIVWHTTEILTDTEGNGRVELEPQAPLDQSSIWAVIDLTTGASGVVASGSGLLLEDSAPADLVTWEADGTAATFGTRLGAADVVVVRPGVGAWSLSAQDGGTLDLDGQLDGVLLLNPTDLEAVGPGATATLGNLQAGDVIFALNPRTLHFHQQRLSEQGG